MDPVVDANILFAALKELDDRWNKILEEEEFIPLDEL